LWQEACGADGIIERLRKCDDVSRVVGEARAVS